MRQAPAASRSIDTLTLIAGTWLACGCVLLGLTPLPWHNATFGWAPAFWMLAAPCLLLLARAWWARQAAGTTASRDPREHLARSYARSMPMASYVRPRTRPRMAASPRAEACSRPAHPRSQRPARRAG